MDDRNDRNHKKELWYNIYRDREGKEITLLEAVKLDPDWAAARIQILQEQLNESRDKSECKVKTLENYIEKSKDLIQFKEMEEKYNMLSAIVPCLEKKLTVVERDEAYEEAREILIKEM